MTDTIESLRARLAEVERERDEALATMAASNANALRAQHDATDGDARWVREQARIAKERDAALAACAEMRAALERSTNAHQAALYDEDLDRDDERDAQRVIDDTRALLSRPDLGAGKVLVPREVVGRVRDALTAAENQMCAVFPRGHGCVCGCPVIDGHTSACVVVRAMRDLDALLKKGGG